MEHTGEILDLENKDVVVPWRFLTDSDHCFDELVLGHGVHLERMDELQWWIGIDHPNGSRFSFFIDFEPGGKVRNLSVAETPDGDSE